MANAVSGSVAQDWAGSSPAFVHLEMEAVATWGGHDVSLLFGCVVWGMCIPTGHTSAFPKRRKGSDVLIQVMKKQKSHPKVHLPKIPSVDLLPFIQLSLCTQVYSTHQLEKTPTICWGLGPCSLVTTCARDLVPDPSCAVFPQCPHCRPGSWGDLGF